MKIDPTAWLEIVDRMETNSPEAAFMYELLASINANLTTVVQERISLENKASDLVRERQAVTREQETINWERELMQQDRLNHAETQKLPIYAQKSLQVELAKGSNNKANSTVIPTPRCLSSDPGPFSGHEKTEDKRQEAFEDCETSIKLC